MQVLRLRARNFRLLATLDIALHPRLNLVIGDNAAGKTTLLETLYAASHGRPVSGIYGDALGPAASGWSVQVQGRVQDDMPATEIEVAFHNRRHSQRIDQQDCGRADLARQLPLALLNPKSHALIGEGPAQRRRYLDWGMFHVEHQFIDVWRRYRRALRQRNVVLRTGGGSDLLRPWTEEVAISGELLHEIRQRQLRQIEAPIRDMLSWLVGGGSWSIGLDAGWDMTQGLAERLRQTETSDRRLGATQNGPHRAELRIHRDGDDARRRISRGEEKLTAAAMLLVQAAHVSRTIGRQVMLMVDDFTSELGLGAQERLLEALTASGSQVFITSLAMNEILRKTGDVAMFHVEHGVVGRVVN